jgi:hypothetical protein
MSSNLDRADRRLKIEQGAYVVAAVVFVVLGVVTFAADRPAAGWFLLGYSVLWVALVFAVGRVRLWHRVAMECQDEVEEWEGTDN